MVVVGALVITPFVLHFAAKWRLDAYRSQLIREGEKLDFAQLAPAAVSNGFANGASLLAAESAIGNKLRELSPAAMRYVAPGKARVAWRERVMIQEVDPNYVPEVGTHRVTTNVWPLFEKEFSKTEDKLKTLREATAQPLQFQTTYAGMNTILSHLAFVKAAAGKLMAASTGHLRARKINEATEDLLAQARLVSNWEHEPFLISQLVRTSCASYACSSTWEALQTGKLTDAQLRELQEAFERVDLLSDGALSVRGDRATANDIISETRKDIRAWTGTRNTNRLDEFGEMFGQMLSEPKAGFREMMDRYPKYWAWCWVGSYDDERKFLQNDTTIARSLDETKRTGWNPAMEPKIIEETDALHSSWMFDMTSALLRGAKKFVMEQSEVSLTITAIALERYRLKHGTLPQTLSELAPEFVKTVPMDYEDGKAVRYSLRGDGTYLLYSVGDDGRDDGGDATPVPPHDHGMFFGKDIVWPLPATHEEVQAFEQAEAKKKQKN